jgi:hypothetical protein
MLWLVLYVVGFFAMFRASVRFARTDSEYDWDMDDVHDVAMLTTVSFAVSLIWPISLVAGITMALVKKGYNRGT